jgi:hypothetical protein
MSGKLRNRLESAARIVEGRHASDKAKASARLRLEQAEQAREQREARRNAAQPQKGELMVDTR